MLAIVTVIVVIARTVEAADGVRTVATVTDAVLVVRALIQVNTTQRARVASLAQTRETAGRVLTLTVHAQTAVFRSISAVHKLGVYPAFVDVVAAVAAGVARVTGARVGVTLRYTVTWKQDGCSVRFCLLPSLRHVHVHVAGSPPPKWLS